MMEQNRHRAAGDKLDSLFRIPSQLLLISPSVIDSGSLPGFTVFPVRYRREKLVVGCLMTGSVVPWVGFALCHRTR